MIKFPSRLLVTDLDGTLVGDGPSARALLSWWRHNRDDVRLVYNTARTYTSASALLHAQGLPWPDALVTGIGTEIRYRRFQGPDRTWARRVAARWDRAAVLEIAGTLGRCLIWQPAQAQGPYKVSFEIRDPADAARFFDRLLAARLWVHGLLTDDRWVDVIPFRAGKGAAAAHLRMRFGIAPERMLATGDSDNDLGMLARLGPAVAVGNASASLLDLLGPQVYRARSPAARGIIEGLLHYGWC